MNWNKAYKIYEIVAGLVIGLCWWAIFSGQSTQEVAQWQAFNRTLETAVSQATQASQESDRVLRLDVKKGGNSTHGLENIKRAEILQQRTNLLIAQVEKVKNQLKKLPQDASTPLIREEGVTNIKQQLDTYVKWLNSKDFNDLDVPQFVALTEGIREKDFAQTYFTNTLPAETISLLTQKQLTAKYYEAKILKRLSVGDFWDSGFFFTLLGCNVVTNTVQVGDSYTADMFLMASSSKAWPRMFLNNQPLRIFDGQAQVAFKTQRVGKQYWKGKISYTQKGKDSSILLNIPFQVFSSKK